MEGTRLHAVAVPEGTRLRGRAGHRYPNRHHRGRRQLHRRRHRRVGRPESEVLT